LLYIFFDELKNTNFFNSNNGEINKRTELQTEKQHITERFVVLKEESKKAA
jgi:hypothetical protein